MTYMRIDGWSGEEEKLSTKTLRFTSRILGLLNLEDSVAHLHPFRNWDILFLLSTLRYSGTVGTSRLETQMAENIEPWI